MGAAESTSEIILQCTTKRARYRVWQFWRAWVARPLPPAAWKEIGDVLDSSEQDLFSRQSLAGQQHGYRVMRMLKLAGHGDPDLLAAALLHDVGKIHSQGGRWAKSIVVLAEAFLPEKANAWASGEPKGWKRPFVVKARHAEWGASSAKAAGSSPLTVSLIRRHQGPRLSVLVDDEDRLLALLQRADDMN